VVVKEMVMQRAEREEIVGMVRPAFGARDHVAVMGDSVLATDHAGRILKRSRSVHASIHNNGRTFLAWEVEAVLVLREDLHQC
jgi:hypothetical protein